MSLLLFAALTLDDPAPPTRAEVCYAHAMVMIEDAMAETGRVAGPSWFIRDWWEERLTDGERDEARQTAVKAQIRSRATADPEASQAENKACVDEAIKAGAVPGWNG